MSLLLSVVIGFLAIMLPGIFLSLALLKKTSLHIFEIVVIGFIFGLIFPPALVWLEAYLIPFNSIFSYSENLYNINVVVLTLIGILLCWQQGVFATMGPTRDERKDELTQEEKGLSAAEKEVRAEMKGESHERQKLRELRRKLADLRVDSQVIKDHEAEEEKLRKHNDSELQLVKDQDMKDRVLQTHRDAEERMYRDHEAQERELLKLQGVSTQKSNAEAWVWAVLLLLMLVTFATRFMSIGIAPNFFEFDPYFDMLSTQAILTYGQQLLYSHSAWPTLTNGTIQRVEPIVPYLEAYWYNISNGPTQYLDTALLSDTGSFYPPITAALLVFVVFMMIYHDYGKLPALTAAALTAGMPTLISTFIAGEQLLEPWGIFTMFFFVAAYMLAAKHPKEKRFAVLAAIAFISTFLGAHYYTVTAGILTVYVVLQGLVQLFRKEDMHDFYVMNAIVIGIIAVFYLIYSPYGGALADRIPTLVGIPVIVSFPLAALLFVVILDYIPKILAQYKIFREAGTWQYMEVLIAMLILSILLIIFTPLGKPVQTYITLSEHFTTASIPLFATVQEYAPTGINYDFGSGGFGEIGASIGGVAIIVWAVMLAFVVFSAIAIYYRKSTSNMMYIAAIIPLAVAGSIEVKYLPHFGVGYILALAIIIGEVTLLVKDDYKLSAKKPKAEASEGKHKTAMMVIAAFCIFLILIELVPSLFSLLAAAANPNCNTLANQDNALGYNIYCNTIPQYWLTALQWMQTHIGPSSTRVLAWWDYGDWINWFGNTNAVLRGDNSVAQSDYNTAAQFVLSSSDGITPQTLGTLMDSFQAKYVIFDDQLQQKWQALDFLACIDVNQTTLAYADAQGASEGEPYVLGTSQCEIEHDPVFALVPVLNASTATTSDFCQFGNSSTVALRSLFIYGEQAVNTTYCVPTSVYTAATPAPIYYQNGTKLNAVIIPVEQFFYGEIAISGQPYADFMVLYMPNGPNNTITDAPTDFYNSNYYQGWMFGKLNGYTLVYPENFTGINYINSTNPIMIFALDNYTGGLPPQTPKPSYIDNNYTIPG